MKIYLVFLLFTISGCLQDQKVPEKHQDRFTKVKVEAVKEASSNASLVALGVIKSHASSRISFAMGGRLITREVNVGDQVKAGDLVARLDQSGFSIGVQAAKASLQARIEERDQLSRDAQRARKLDKEGALTKANLEKVESGLERAQAGVKAMKQALRESKRKRGETRLHAPFSGTITTVYAQVGEVLGAGHPVVRIVGDKGLEAIVEVEGKTLSKFTTGDTVILVGESQKGEGKIRSKSLATNEGGLHPIVIDIPKGKGWREGENIEILFPTKAEKKTVVPLVAIVDPSGQKPFVWKLENDHVSKSFLKLGALHGTDVEVSGITPGEFVITAGQNRLLAGDKVTF